LLQEKAPPSQKNFFMEIIDIFGGKATLENGGTKKLFYGNY